MIAGDPIAWGMGFGNGRRAARAEARGFGRRWMGTGRGRLETRCGCGRPGFDRVDGVEEEKVLAETVT